MTDGSFGQLSGDVHELAIILERCLDVYTAHA